METLAVQPFITGKQPESQALYVVPDGVEDPKAYSVRDAEYEPETQARFKQWLGSLGVAKAVEAAGVEAAPKDTNLLERLRAARAGSKEALKSVAMNVGKAVYEGCFKVNHVTTTWMDRTETGGLTQFGQPNDSVHRNAIILRPDRHPNLQAITHVEALNGHRIDDGLEAGKLRDNYFVVASIVPAGVPEKQLGPEGEGYFLEDLTFVIQATTEQSNARVKTESGFMAGVEADENDSFEDRLAKRHDIAALIKVYERLGLKPPSRTATGFLEGGIYIPKAWMPNGVVDVMRWCAEAADEVLERQVERKTEDFLALVLESRRRETSLESTKQQVIEDLLAAADRLTTPMEAVQLMWDLVKIHTLKESFTNTNIDPKVFGRIAAPDIAMIQYHYQQGNQHLAQDLIEKVKETAVMTGCGGGSSSGVNERDAADGSSDGKESSSAGSDRHGARQFTCSNGHVNIRPKNELIDRCQHKGCKAVVACKPKKA